jgi:hypothetical protein
LAKNKAGRPPKYKKCFNEIAESACAELGADDKQLGKLFGVSKTAIENWKLEHEGFLDSIKRGKDVYDTAIVEVSLLKRANGYGYVEKHTEAIVNKDGQMTELKRVKNVTKEVVPDTTAAIFWLKNRHPGRWRDIKAVELSGKGGGPIQTANANIEITLDMTPKEASKIYAQMIKEINND